MFSSLIRRIRRDYLAEFRWIIGNLPSF